MLDQRLTNNVAISKIPKMTEITIGPFELFWLFLLVEVSCFYNQNSGHILDLPFVVRKIPAAPTPSLLICTWTVVRWTGFLAFKNQFRNWFLQASQEIKIQFEIINALSVCTWFLKNQVWKIKFDKLNF